MNYDKNPKLARRLANEQKALRKKVKKDPQGKNHARANWDITFDNFIPQAKPETQEHEDEYEYQS